MDGKINRLCRLRVGISRTLALLYLIDQRTPQSFCRALAGVEASGETPLPDCTCSFQSQASYQNERTFGEQVRGVCRQLGKVHVILQSNGSAVEPVRRERQQTSCYAFPHWLMNCAFGF